MNKVTFFVSMVTIIGLFVGLMGCGDADIDIDVSEAKTVDVDYSFNLEEMIAAGQYDWVNGNIISENFPVPNCESGAVELHFAYFHNWKATEPDWGASWATDELAKRGFRPAVLPELLALGATHPEIADDLPIMAIGSKWQYKGGYVGLTYPQICKYDSMRMLDLQQQDWGGRWEWCKFLVVRK